MRRKGQLVVKVDDLLSQQTLPPAWHKVCDNASKPDLAKSQGSERPEHSGKVSLSIDHETTCFNSEPIDLLIHHSFGKKARPVQMGWEVFNQSCP